MYTEDIFDESAIVIRIEDEAAGQFLNVSSINLPEDQRMTNGVSFNDRAEFELFVKQCRKMLSEIEKHEKKEN